MSVLILVSESLRLLEGGLFPKLYSKNKYVRCQCKAEELYSTTIISWDISNHLAFWGHFQAGSFYYNIIIFLNF